MDTAPDSLSLQALVDITNPTPYAARVPFASLYVESNGTTIGELGEALARLNFTLPAPRLRFPGQDGDDDGQDEPPRFIRDATFHILSSTATFTLFSPFLHDTVFIDSVNGRALYNHTEPIGRIVHSFPFAVLPGVSVTPRLPVDWSMGSVGYGKVRKALGGRLKLDGEAEVRVRLGRWTERLWITDHGSVGLVGQA
ncbi:hypothetical protein VTH06DRAFT_1434 [Thermothelomyces fergusii]